jgi:hypothetical protein
MRNEAVAVVLLPLFSTVPSPPARRHLFFSSPSLSFPPPQLFLIHGSPQCRCVLLPSRLQSMPPFQTCSPAHLVREGTRRALWLRFSTPCSIAQHA